MKMTNCAFKEECLCSECSLNSVDGCRHCENCNEKRDIVIKCSLQTRSTAND